MLTIITVDKLKYDLESCETGDFSDVRREPGDFKSPRQEAAQRLQVLAGQTPHAHAVVRATTTQKHK